VDILRKLQNLPESKRKTILWSVVIVVGICFFILWIRNVQGKLRSFKKEEFKIPPLSEELKGMPKIEFPEITEETLKELEEAAATTTE
jgi:hypothetical protein